MIYIHNFNCPESTPTPTPTPTPVPTPPPTGDEIIDCEFCMLSNTKQLSPAQIDAQMSNGRCTPKGDFCPTVVIWYETLSSTNEFCYTLNGFTVTNYEGNQVTIPGNSWYNQYTDWGSFDGLLYFSSLADCIDYLEDYELNGNKLDPASGEYVSMPDNIFNETIYETCP